MRRPLGPRPLHDHARRVSAFTLVEIMAVVLIIALLGTLVGTAVVGQIDKARITTAKTQIKQLEAALEFYQMDNGRYPTSEQGLEALVREPTIEPLAVDYRPEGYLKGGSVPSDPWKEDYHYESPGANNPHSFDLWTFGKDRQAGGEGTSADVGNWASDES